MATTIVSYISKDHKTGVLTKPVVDPKIRHTVPHKQVEPAVCLSDIVKSRTDQTQSQITQKNQLSVLGLVQGAVRVEVVDTTKVTVALALATTFKLTLVVVVARDVGEQVHGPTEKLLQDHVRGSEDGGLLHELREFVDGLANVRGVLLAGLGHENHITTQVSSGLVVLAVGDLPGEVRHQKERVADPAHRVIENLGRRESLVTTLVGHHPETSTEETLHKGVESPSSRAGVDVGHGLGGYIVVEEVEGGTEAEQIPGNV